MTKINSIRQLRKNGESVAEIARKLDVSRDSVYKYLKQDDFSPKFPAPAKKHPSKIDPYKSIINRWLDEDNKNWQKQRHTARRIWQRLCDEYNADIAECTVSRYVAKEKKKRKQPYEHFLDLVWQPGEAQADFGVADFCIQGIKKRMSYFVLTFPHSNVGLSQILPGQNAECVCEGLKRIFSYIGFVPNRIVFDNATGIGRRVGDKIRTTELFEACAAHYGFDYSFCNPNSGNEKGNVENKVGTIRKNLFVPVPRIENLASYNARLLEKCIKLSDKSHWSKGQVEIQLFNEDCLAMQKIPKKEFSAVRYVEAKTDKLGKITIDGPHIYASSPEYAQQNVYVALSAFEVEIYDENATLIAKHRREYGKAPTDSTNPASQLKLLCKKTNAWKNSQIREKLSENLRNYLDSLDKKDLRMSLRLMRDENERSGWDLALNAVENAYKSTGRLDAASISMSAARTASGFIDYGYRLNLSEYDQIVNR